VCVSTRLHDLGQVPSGLVDVELLSNFEDLLREYKQQGLSDEQMKELGTEKNFDIFKQLHRAEVEDAVRLGIVFRDIAAKENIVVTEEEMLQQFDFLKARLNGAAYNEEQAR
jgi:FKBP-type peptidyl-prolyl cis-trans isomerase (trigger factor)